MKRIILLILIIGLSISLLYSQQSKSNEKNFKGKYFMLGAGTGKSYGGYGLRAQWRFGHVQGYGIHAGVGYYPKAPVLASAGVKFFPYKNLYIDAQFGTTLMERTIITGHWDSYVVGYISIPTFVIDSSYNASYIGYGPSILVGGDWTWGKKIAYGINFGLGASYVINGKSSAVVSFFYPKKNQKFRGAGDLGFIIRF